MHPTGSTLKVFLPFILAFLPNECDPMSDVLWRMTHAQREHDPTLWADPRHARRKLPGRACRWHDGRQGTTEQRAGCLNQLRLVLVTPLFVGERTETHSQANLKNPKRDIKNPNSFCVDTQMSLHRSKVRIQASKSIAPPQTNWLGRTPWARLVKEDAGRAVQLN